MTPRFSLTLSHEGIGLLHRAGTSWTKVGEVPIDDPALPEALRMLRDTASALEGGGILSKLVLPDSQVLYATLPAGEGDPDATVRIGLDGRTPYAIDEIVYDYEVDGDVIHVAAVARETLQEAEAFAVEHRFNPVCFAALPAPEQFPREPSFGETFAAASLLPAGEALNLPAGTEEEAAQTSAAAEVLPDPAALSPQPATPSEKPAPGAQAGTAPEPEPAPAPLISPLPAPEDRPAFSTRRDTAQAPKVPNKELRAEPRLHLAAEPSAPLVDLTERNLGITAPQPPETTPGPEAPAAPKAEAQTPRPKTTKGRKTGKAKKTVTPAPAPALQAPPPAAAQSTAVADPPPDPRGLGFDLFASQDNTPGRPLVGLALVAVLILVMLAVAVWTLLPGGDDEVAAPAPAPALVQSVTAPPAPTVPTESSVPRPAALSLDPEEAPEPEEPLQADVATEITPPAALPLSPDEALAAYAATGIWTLPPAPIAPPAQDRLDGLYVASLDPKVTAHDAIALPAAQPDAPLETRANPPAQGEDFTLDDQGLVTPSVDGTLSPEGIRVFAGAPPLVPPRRPDTGADAPAVDAERARLADIRPRARPGDLIERNERANLGGRTLAELKQRRPRARPVSAQEQAAAASAAAVAIALDDSAAPLVTDNRFAMASSRRPGARPKTFASTVNAARKSQEESVRTAAAVPAASRLTPRVPSSASVSKQATVANAINLRKVNLIGVYGSSSDRRALVRLPSGRYVKVKVGDRVDGGKVAAISDTELRYIKKGRSVVLKLPRG